MFPAAIDEARTLLATLGAPASLLLHTALVGEAAEEIIAALSARRVPIDEDFVRVGVVLHDAGKIAHPQELRESGDAHEPAGERLLLAAGVTPALARVCLSHARWPAMDCSLEELLVALADKLWKGVRRADLEERVIAEAAQRSRQDRWDLFVPLDSTFERIADGGHARLERSRQQT